MYWWRVKNPNGFVRHSGSADTMRLAVTFFRVAVDTRSGTFKEMFCRM